MGHEPEHLVVGHLSRAHGIRGEVLVTSLTDRPEEVFSPGRRLLVGTEAGELEDPSRELEVEAVRPFKRGFLLRFGGVADRNAAEALASRYVLLPLDVLGEPEEDELYYHQLLGLVVETVDGREIGRVREVYETEPRHLLEVKGQDRIHLIPYSRGIVKRVDLAAGLMVIDPPSGLLDL